MSESVGVISLDLVIKDKLSDGVKAAVNGAKITIKSSSDSISKAMSEPFEKAANDVRAPMKQIEKTVSDSAERIAKVKKKFMGYDPSAMKFMEDYEKRLKNSKTPKKETPKTDNRAEKLYEGFQLATKPVDLLEQKLANINSQIGNQQEKLRNACQKYIELADAVGDDATETKKVGVEIDSIQSKLISLQSSANQVSDKIQKETDKVAESVKKSTSSAVENAKSSMNGAAQSAKSAANQSKSAFKSAGNGIKNSMKNATSHAKSGFDSLKSKMRSTAKIGSSAFSKMGKTIKGALKSVFFASVLYAGFKAIKSFVSDAVSSNKQFSDSLTQVKNNLAVAFTPIFNAIMPALNTLMSGLATVTKNIAAFIAGLFGTTYKQAAKATNKLKSVSNQSEKTAKDAKDNLQSFDKLNVRQKDSSGDDSSDSAVSTDDSGTEKAAGIAEKLKNMFSKGDFSSVGKIIGGKINKAFLTLDKWISWSNVGGIITKVITSFSEGLNSAVKTINWELIGKTFADGFNSVMNTLYLIATKIDWSAVGSAIGEGANGLVKNIDWKKLGKTLSTSFIKAVDMIRSAIQTFDWQGLGKGVADGVNAIDWVGILSELAGGISDILVAALDLLIGFAEGIDWGKLGSDLWNGLIGIIKSIDWGELISKAYRLLGDALGGAVALIVGFAKALWESLKSAFQKTKDYFAKYIKEAGGNVIQGLLNGIWDGIKNIGQWISDHIFKPFINGFKKCFGIHSPSKEMGKMGGFLIDGFKNGVLGIWDKVKSIFTGLKDNICGVFTNLWNSVKNGVSTAWNGIISVISSIGDKVKKVFSGIVDGIKNIWNGIMNFIKAPINFIIDALNTLVKGINKISFDVPDWVPLIGGKKFGFDIPQIPKLATGGLATAPTLAMVGDNKNAGTDPEVIAPLSKLKNYIGIDDTEVLRLLERLIADVNSGTSSIVKAICELITCLKNKKLIDSPEKFARDYKPYFDAESKRSGTNTVAGFVN